MMLIWRKNGFSIGYGSVRLYIGFSICEGRQNNDPVEREKIEGDIQLM
jgi:hypothetical protein